MKRFFSLLLLISVNILVIGQNGLNEQPGLESSVEKTFDRVRNHEFNPLNKGNSMTQDHFTGKDGIADREDMDWLVRLLAVRDLVRAGNEDVRVIATGLTDKSPDVRQVCAMALGILHADQGAGDLETVLRNDSNAMVRSQAAIALGQIEAEQSLSLLKEKLKDDPSRDVRHQCELAIYQIEHKMGATAANLIAWIALDETTFESVKKGSVAADFTLGDTEGKHWQLSEFREKHWVVLIWVFADWCPVCHGEFHDLMEMKEAFDHTGVQVFTLETHDSYRGRVMVGKELEPEYWFAKESFKTAYTNQIWWPHLIDHAGAIAAVYGADPLAFSVHAEYINRPTTVIIDPTGTVRFLYQGTFWGDRPSIKQTLEMIQTKTFSFEKH